MAKAKPKTKQRAKKSSSRGKFSRTQLLLFIVVFGLIGSFGIWKSFAAPGGTCVPGTPGVFPQNTYAWAALGSYGMPGQQLKYVTALTNYDKNCSSSVFTVTTTSPSGFVVSNPISTVTVNSASSVYLTTYVTSPNPVADGDYPLIITATRTISPVPSTATTYYKAYTTDTTPPKVYYTYPDDGQILTAGKGKTGSSTRVSFESSDDHAVKKVEVYVDNALLSSVNCENISSTCGISPLWPLKGHSGAHTATYKSYDWFGNVTTQVNSFTVQ